MLNPSVYLLGEEAASIAYTKLSQIVDLTTGRLSSEQSEETRIWHKRDGNKWFCVHLHRSIGGGGASSGTINRAPSLESQQQPTLGPQTNMSLLRSLANQQQLASWASLQAAASVQHKVAGGVPLISLNHSSTGSQSHQQPASPAAGNTNNTSR